MDFQIERVLRKTTFEEERRSGARLAAPRIGHCLAFGAARQQHVGRMTQEVIGERVAVFRVRVADQP